MNQKKLLAASVAAACLAMTTSALAADYSNHTETADGTTLAGHLNSTSDAINSTNDTFENNKLTFTATGGLTTAAGIAASNTTVTVTDGTFTSNEVSDSDGSINGVYGTAVGVSGAADGTSALTITNSTFTSNKGTSYNQTEGGAVYQSIGTATIKGSTFDQNVAEVAKETTESEASAMGGAVSLWGTTTVIEDSTFTNNSTASFTEKGSSFGGALYLRGGRWGGAENLSASIKNSTFVSNSARGTGAKGGALYAKSDYVDNKHLILNLDLDNVTFKNNISDRWGGAMFVEGEGSLTMKDVTFEGNQGVYGSALVVNGNKPNETVLNNVETATVTATNVNYLNNVSKDYGATLWLYTKTQYNQTGGSFVGNKTTGSGNLLGAVFVKGAKAVFTDVLFQNNTVESSDGIAAGGAVYVDIVSNSTVGVVGGSVKFIATKDMTYSGNNVTGKDIPVETYGYMTATAGGFLLLDRGTTAEFEVKDDATLTIGEEGSTGHMDSIASAYPLEVGQKVASITKTGSGTLVINSDMNFYYGTVDVQAGRMEVNTTWSLREAATISGGTLALKDFNFDKMPDPLSTVGSITVQSGGTLETASAQLFKNGLGDGSVTDAGDALKADKVTVEEGGTIALNDAVYNLDYASSLGTKYTNAKYVLLGQLSDASKDDLTFHAFGKRTLKFLKARLHSSNDFTGVAAGTEQNNAARDFTFAVKLRDAAAHFRPQANLSDVAQNRRRSRSICFEHDRAEVVKRLQIPLSAHHEFAFAHLDGTAARFLIRSGKRRLDVPHRNAVLLELDRIRNDLIFLHGAAHARHFGYARDGLEFILEEPVLERPQAFQIILSGFVHQSVLIDPAHTGGIRTKFGRDAAREFPGSRIKRLQHARTRPVKIRSVLKKNVDKRGAEE